MPRILWIKGLRNRGTSRKRSTRTYGKNFTVLGLSYEVSPDGLTFICVTLKVSYIKPVTSDGININYT